MPTATKAKKYRSKFFRVALEGDTTDGRVIQRDWLVQAAANYNQALYGARIWIEHLRSYMPEGPFGAYGDVTALKAEEVEIDIAGKKQKRMGLFAQIEPTDTLVALVNAAKQKVFTSVEIDPNFAKTGSAYMVGLGVTDSPASLGTDMLAFAAKHPEANPLKARKTNENTLFTAAAAVALELEEVAEESVAPSALESFFKQLGELVRGNKPESSPPAAPASPANSPEGFAALADALEKLAGIQRDQFASLQKQMKEGADTLAGLRAEHDAFVNRMSATPAGGQPARPPVTGQTGAQQTDC